MIINLNNSEFNSVLEIDFNLKKYYIIRYSYKSLKIYTFALRNKKSTINED